MTGAILEAGVWSQVAWGLMAWVLGLRLEGTVLLAGLWEIYEAWLSATGGYAWPGPAWVAVDLAAVALAWLTAAYIDHRDRPVRPRWPELVPRWGWT